MKNIYQTDLVHRYVKILLRGRRETYTVQKTLLVEKICNSRIKRLIWGSRGNNHFFCSEIHLNLCLQFYLQKAPLLQFYLQKPSLYTRLVRSTIEYFVHMKQVHPPSTASAYAGFWLLFHCNSDRARWKPRQPAAVYSQHSVYPMVGMCPAPNPVLCVTQMQLQGGEGSCRPPAIPPK